MKSEAISEIILNLLQAEFKNSPDQNVERLARRLQTHFRLKPRPMKSAQEEEGHPFSIESLPAGREEV